MRLSDLYLPMSTEDRERFAEKVGASTGYLWQLATHWKGKRPTLTFMEKLVAADSRLTVGELAEEFAGEPTEKAGA